MSTTLPETIPAATRVQRVAELDGLRAFAILPVIFHHCCPMNKSVLSFLGQAGWMGVDLFFVLSGYLITGILLKTAGQPHYYRNFIVRRTLRIFPLYYACLLVFTAGVWFSGGPPLAAMQRFGIGWFVVYLENIREVFLGYCPPVFSFMPLWSLQVEEQFYLFYPPVVLLLARQNLRRLLICCVVAAPLFRVLLFLLLPGNSGARYVLTPCRMDALALGGLVAILAKSRPDLWPSRAVLRWGLVLTGAGVFVTFVIAWLAMPVITLAHPLMSTVGYSVNAFAFAFLLALIVLRPPARLVAVLRWRPLVYTGTIAYGLYILHAPAWWAARTLALHVAGIDVPSRSGLSMLLALAASYLVAGISWRFFETPILALKERIAPSQG